MDKYITFQGTSIYYHDEGEGLPLLLIHGFCEDSSVWQQIEAALLGSVKVRIIRPDLPGFGRSGVWGGAEPLSIAAMALLVKAILDKERLEQCVMIGHSMGGYITLAFAEYYRKMLKGLGLFHSSAFSDDENKKAERAKAIRFIEDNGTKGFVNELIPKLFSSEFAAQHQHIVSRLKEQAYSYPAKGVTDALYAMRERPDRTAVLANAGCPVLFIIGKQDAAVPFEKSMLQCHLPPLSSVHILENAGHMGMMEAERQSIDIFSNFLNFILSQEA